MSIKGKLLEAVGEVDVSDIGTEALVDILTSRIKAQDKKIQELHGENAEERQRLHDEMEKLRRERNRMRSDPLYCAAGRYFFQALDGTVISFGIQGERVQAANVKKTISYSLQRLSPREAEILENEK